MKTIFKKEVKNYFNNPFGYIVIALFALFANFLFIKDIFSVGSASMRPFFNLTSWLLVLFVPALAMRSFAEEKKANTLEMLLTLPIDEKDIILGKFFALVTVEAIGLLLTMGLVVSLSFISTLYMPELIVGYAGLVAVAAILTSISMFFSIQTSNQIVAFFTSVITSFLFFAFSSDFVASFLPRTIGDQLVLFTPPYQLEAFIKGVLDLRSLVYFISLSALFLFFTFLNLKNRK